MSFPDLSSSGDQVFGERGRSYLLPLLSLLLSFLRVQPAFLLRRILTIQNPKKTWLEMKPACSILTWRIPGTEERGQPEPEGSIVAPESHHLPNCKQQLLLLLSHFSRVRLCAIP